MQWQNATAAYEHVEPFDYELSLRPSGVIWVGRQVTLSRVFSGLSQPSVVIHLDGTLKHTLRTFNHLI